MQNIMTLQFGIFLSLKMINKNDSSIWYIFVILFQNSRLNFDWYIFVTFKKNGIFLSFKFDNGIFLSFSLFIILINF
jgi:hypothetical protein